MGENEEKVEANDNDEMKPWEQHSSVILMPRYDYNAPQNLLQRSHSGFLITCTIKREKSATKEAMAILDKYADAFKSGISNPDPGTKKRKICGDDTDDNSANASEKLITSEDDDGNRKDDGSSSELSEKNYVLSLVKLTRSGLLLLTFAKENTVEAADIVCDIFKSLESGSLKSPEWCHRIFPIQATCRLNEQELRQVVSKLVRQFVNAPQDKLSQPITFAVGYNRRGIESTEMKNPKDGDQFPLLDRDKCFGVVAIAVKDIVTNAVVDLKSPQMSVLVELLPLSGVPKGSLVVAVSVLPFNLVSTKPRLCIKPLVRLVSGSNGQTARFCSFNEISFINESSGAMLQALSV
ncbi:uncharacterized protein [Rutidosis leptorrhynchoides]|uniref:uncharacterized protein n=1 Tax=Rutidosis leptorrhynchoides TaxID=125765 RepID=UPI003A98EE8A